MRSALLTDGAVAASSSGITHVVREYANEYSWALWLAAPVLFVTLAALWSWGRGRARKPASMRTTMSEHDNYLTVLSRVTAARPQPRFAAVEGTASQSADEATTHHDVAS